MTEPRVYKTSPILLVIIVIFFLFLLGTLIFVFGSSSAGFMDTGWIMIPLAAFLLFIFGSVLIVIASKTTVSDDELSVRGLFGTKTLRWTDIGSVSGWGNSMKLMSRDEDVKISVSPRMPGYEDVIEVVGVKRPDLFSPLEHNEMRRGLSAYMGVLFGILLLLGVSTAFVVAVMDSPDTSISAYMPLLFIVGVALFLAVSILSAPRALILEGRTMELKYLLSEKTIRADEIRQVQLGYTQTRNGKRYFIALHLTSGKNIRLSGMGLSLPIAYLVLKNWHQGGARGQASSVNVAPNWSDNTWK